MKNAKIIISLLLALGSAVFAEPEAYVFDLEGKIPGSELQELQTLYKWKNYDASKDHETPGGLGFENVNFSKPVRIHGTPLNSVQEVQDYLDKNAGSWSAAEFARVQRYLQENGINIFKVNGVGSGKGTAWTSQTAHQR